MRRLLLGCAVLICCSDIHADQKAEEVLMVSAAVADIITTEMALRNHPHLEEMNPMLQSSGARIVAKAGVTAALIIAARKLESNGHRDIAKWLRWPSIAIWSGAAGYNVSISMAVER